MDNSLLISLPASGKGPGLLVLHPWWGLNDFIKGFCQRLSREGFVVAAPDLYHGEVAATIPEAEALRGKMKRAQAQQEMLSALEVLRTHPAVTSASIGLIGFSMGAFFSLWLAEQSPASIGAVVLFYGARSSFNTAPSKAAFLGHFAEKDPYESESTLKKLERNLIKAGRPAEFFTYPGTGHWFFESDRPDAYIPEAAELAWQRTLKFLQQQLAG